MTSALTSTYITYLDLAKMLLNGGNEIADPIDMLAQSNPILMDAHVEECNTPTGHVSTWVTSVPSSTKRQYNQGIAPSKGTTKQVTDTCSSYHQLSDFDVELAKRAKNPILARKRFDSLHVTGMNNDVATDIFAADARSTPEGMHGLSPRYSSLTAGSYYSYVYNASGSGDDNTSIWIVTWGPRTCSLIYPQGTSGGLRIVDRGEQRVLDASSNPYYAYESQFIWDVGVAVIDPRFVTRICNIDVSDLTEDGATGADILKSLTLAYAKRPAMTMGQNVARTYIYCSQNTWAYLWLQSSNKSNVQLSQGNAGGVPFVMWNGIPIHICEAISEAEATVD